MDENLLIPFLGELKTTAEYTAEQVQVLVNSEGQTIYYVLTRVVGDNGTAREIMRVVTPTAGSAYAATNMALLSMEVPTALAFIGPALGIAVGAGILSQTELFQNIGTKIGESIYCFFTDLGELLFPEETIQAFAEKLDEEGAFEGNSIYDEDLYELISNADSNFSTMVEERQPLPIKAIRYKTYAGGNTRYYELEGEGANNCFLRMHEKSSAGEYYYVPGPLLLSKTNFRVIQRSYDSSFTTLISESYVTPTTFTITISGEQYQYYIYDPVVFSDSEVYTEATLLDYDYRSISLTSFREMCAYLTYGGRIINPYLQPSAVIPSPIPLDIPTTYPSWTPTKVYPDTGDEQTTYPISVPSTIPSTITTPQPEYQTPQPLLDPTTDPRTTQISQLIGDLVLPTPTPIPSPTPQPSPDPDPSPTVNPDPPLDPTQPVEPNPPSANVDPDPTTPTIADPSLVSAAGKLFTVYNPSSTGLNDLGAYLWSTNIIDIVKSIWQNPMDGIISYFVLYATPEANRTSTIYLGALDSGVSSPVVTNQFIDIDCGEVQIKEKWNNIGDYPPYTSIKLFLPFVGFVDINPDDVMGRDDGGGYIKVTYRVDVYTGTCLAQVWVRRAADMANYQILYTYNGNCAQQIPLTGATYQGLMQTLVGASVGFASAGLTGALASAATQFAGHQQVQMQRSGNMSANAGVLGQRKPYLIISRNNVYYATNFAEYYGYPAHATVVLGNMSGYVRVRDIHLEVPATSEELDEIEALLKEGVWF